jgi:hypothetical protein
MNDEQRVLQVDEMQGANEQRTETYAQYVEVAAQQFTANAVSQPSWAWMDAA